MKGQPEISDSWPQLLKTVSAVMDQTRLRDCPGLKETKFNG